MGIHCQYSLMLPHMTKSFCGTRRRQYNRTSIHRSFEILTLDEYQCRITLLFGHRSRDVRPVLIEVVNTSKSYSGILISNMSDHLPHFTCLDILSNQQIPPKYIIKEKHDEASILSFYNEIESSLRNTHFPNELTTDPNVTYNLLKKNYIVCQGETHETCEDQIKSL